MMLVAGKRPRGKRLVLLFKIVQSSPLALWPLSDIIILGSAALLDYVLGDPWHWPHPVQGIGWVIQHYAQSCLRWVESPKGLRGLGILMGLGLIGGTGLLVWSVVWVVEATLGPMMGKGVTIVLLASCFAGQSLRRAAIDVLTPLEQGNLEIARQKLALYVGRDTADLPADEIRRAVFETISENATDGVLAPLFYALLGSFLGMGAASMAMAYKAASTLDSMVGYRDPPYTHLGWFSARFEDGLTWLPCRMVVGTIALLSGRPRHVLRLCYRDARADPSPNAGWSECAYAAALGVQVGGANIYRGKLKVKPKLGIAERPLETAIIYQALKLTRYCFLLWLAVGCGVLWLCPL